MTMVYASPPPRRAHHRDSQADVETRVYVRPTPQAWRNVFLQPSRPSDPPLPWATASTVVTLTAPMLPVASPPRAARTKPRRRSLVPWVVVVAVFGIAFGIGRDRALRAELGSVLASHMDVNAIDLCGADGQAAELERLSAENVKRVVHGRADVQTPWEISSFLELKTVWHPIGQ